MSVPQKRLIFSSKIQGFTIKQLDESDDKTEIAKVISSAFGNLQMQTGFPEDLRILEHSLAEVNDLFENGIVIIDEINEKYVGVNFLSIYEEKSPLLRAIGPIAVLPEYQGRGLGRVLMKSIMELGVYQGASTFRLCVDSHNPVSFSLYTSIGYSMRSLLSSLSLPEQPIPIDENLLSKYELKTMEYDDLENIEKYMNKLIGYSRTKELEQTINKKLTRNYLNLSEYPVCLISKDSGSIVGFSCGLNVVSFSGADNEELWKFMFACQLNMVRSECKTEEAWIDIVHNDYCEIMVPSTYPSILRWMLSNKMRIKKNMVEMSCGVHNNFAEAPSVYFPSVEY